MEEDLIKSLVESKYLLNIKSMEPIKNVFKISTEEKNFCLKIIKYEKKHFLFIMEAMKHLQKNDFKSIPKFIKTVDGYEYIELDGKFAYLTEWVNGREANYNNPFDIRLSTEKLAELHMKSRGFFVDEKNLKPRIGWFKWIDTFSTRRNEMLSFKNIIDNKDKKTEFDNIYLKNLRIECDRANKSIEDLYNSDYINVMEQHSYNREFCHHDFAHHNIIINDSDVNIIDFDYCILDSHLHDLSSLLIRRMKDGNWDLDNAEFILNVYSEIIPIKKDEINTMAAFIEFPQAFWQVGIQYYWEHQPWSEDIFIKKLMRFVDDRDERQECIEGFKKKRWEFCQ